MKHVLAATAIAAGTLAACAACAGTSTASGDPGATAAVSTSPSAAAGGGSSAASGSGSNASGGNSGSSGSNSSSTCLPRYLNASATNEQGAAGSDYVDLVFKNLNSQACTLYGYPGVSFAAGNPVTQVGQPAARDSAVNSTLVTLQPQGYAYAVLQIGDAQNWPQSTCQPTATTWLQVIAPNTTNALEVAFKSTACKGDVVTMHVQAVQPGNGS